MTPRFYLLHGPDDFASAEALAALKEKMGDPSLASLNTTVFDGRNLTLGDLRAACDALPFLARRRLVVVEGWLERLAGKGEEAGDETPAGGGPARETLRALAEYLPSLPETTALVMVEHRRLPPGNPILRAASGADWALVREFEPPKGAALAGWIRARAKRAGGALTGEAALALAEMESDPRALDQEIAKLLDYVDYARPVELADVELVSTGPGQAVIFDLVDAIGQRQASAAARELRRLLEHQEPWYVLTMIIRQFRLILLARELLEARAGQGEIARALKLHPFPAEKICAQARNFDLPALEHIYHRLLDYDIAIKTSQFDAEAALDTLVASLTAA